MLQQQKSGAMFHEGATIRQPKEHRRRSESPSALSRFAVREYCPANRKTARHPGSFYRLIGWFCRTGELGPVVEDLSVASINDALDKVLGGRLGPLAEGHLLERNTLSQFKQTLRQAMG